MGQTAELVAHLFDITRRQADEYAAESQNRLARAQVDGPCKDEIEPAFAATARCSITTMVCGRTAPSTAWAKLKPAFEWMPKALAVAAMLWRCASTAAANSAVPPGSSCWPVAASRGPMRGIGGDRLNVGGDPFRGAGRQVLRAEQSDQAVERERRVAGFDRRRQIGHGGGALQISGGEELHLAGLDLRFHDRDSRTRSPGCGFRSDPSAPW